MAASADFETACAVTSIFVVISPRARTLTKSPLRTDRRATSVSSVTWSRRGRELVEVDGRVLHAERVVETLQLGDALLQRHLATFEAASTLPRAMLALGTGAGGLAALAADATTDAWRLVAPATVRVRRRA